MEVKKIVEGMTAPEVAQVIDENFKALNNEKANKSVVDAQIELLVNMSNQLETTKADKATTEEKFANLEETIATNKETADAKLSELGSKVSDVRKDITGEYEFTFPVEENKAIAKNTYVLPFVANEGDTLTWNVEGTTFTNVYVYYTGDSTETAIGAASGYKLSKSIDRVTFAANRAEKTGEAKWIIKKDNSVLDLINENGDNIEHTKSMLSQSVASYFDVTNKNLISKDDMEFGYVTLTGSYVDSDSFKRIKLPVMPFAKYLYNGRFYGSASIVILDLNGSVVKSYSSSTDVYEQEIEIPEYGRNIIMSCAKTEWENFSFIMKEGYNRVVDINDLNGVFERPSNDDILNYTGANRAWIEGYFSGRSIVGSHASYKMCLDFIEVYAEKEYISNVACRVICYNSSKGYIGQIDASSKIPFKTMKNTKYVRVCSTNALNMTLKLYGTFLSERDSVIVKKTTEYHEQSPNEVLKISPNLCNGKFRLYLKYRINEDVNHSSGENKTIVKFKSEDDEISFFVHKEETTNFKEVLTLNGTSVNVSYPIPYFKSCFGYKASSEVLFENRRLPMYKPLCGDWMFYVRYTGTDTNYSTLTMTVTDNNISIVDVGEFSLTDEKTVGDLCDEINNSNPYIEAVVNADKVGKIVKNNLVKCADIPLITSSLVNNQDYTKGTFNDAYPAYVFSRIDQSEHTIEIVSNGVECHVVFDGQNDGQARDINVTNLLSAELIPMLAKGCDIYIGGDENRTNISNKIEYIRLDENTTSDAELVRNHRIVSNYNPLKIALMGHELWEGKELDGIYPTKENLPESWKDDVADPSIAASTERMRKIFKKANESGVKFVSPLDILDKQDKKSMFICFDDYEVRNFYDSRLRRAFDDYCASGVLAIERMNINIDSEAERSKIHNLFINQWYPVIHGYASEQIATLTNEQLYTNNPSIEKSLAQNIQMAREYGLIERVWVYASGAQNANGVMAMKWHGVGLGFMVNFGSKYYICDAANPLYLKRQNASDHTTFRALVEESFVEAELPILSVLSTSSEVGSVTVTFKESNKIGNFETLERGIACRLETGGKPTIKHVKAVANTSAAAQISVTAKGLSSGTYNVCAWARNSIGISYSDYIQVVIP